MEEHDMEIQAHIENGRVPVTVLQILGNIDSSTYQALESRADELINNGSRFILMDLSQCEYISSAGFRALNHIFKKLRSVNLEVNLPDEDTRKGMSAGTYKSPHLKLLKLSPEIRTVFEMSGFGLYLDTFTDMKTAIASF
jgi:anti-anti-sigma factor